MPHPLHDVLLSAYELTQNVRLFTTVGVYEGTLVPDPTFTTVDLLNYSSSTSAQPSGAKLTIDTEAIKAVHVLH